MLSLNIEVAKATLDAEGLHVQGEYVMANRGDSPVVINPSTVTFDVADSKERHLSPDDEKEQGRLCGAWLLNAGQSVRREFSFSITAMPEDALSTEAPCTLTAKAVEYAAASTVGLDVRLICG